MICGKWFLRCVSVDSGKFMQSLEFARKTAELRTEWRKEESLLSPQTLHLNADEFRGKLILPSITISIRDSAKLLQHHHYQRKKSNTITQITKAPYFPPREIISAKHLLVIGLLYRPRVAAVIEANGGHPKY